MSKKPHPVDVMDAARVARAKSFNVHARRGPWYTRNERCTSLLEAARKAADWKGEGLRPLVYALNPGEPQTIVPRSVLDQALAGA